MFNVVSSNTVLLLNQPGPRRLAAALLQQRLDLLLALAQAALAHAHPSGHVPLRHDAHAQAEGLLDPLGDPFAGVDAAALDDLADLVGHARELQLLVVVVVVVAVAAGGRQRRGRVQPADPLGRDVLADGAVDDVVDGVEHVDGEAHVGVGGAVLGDGARFLLGLAGGAAGEQRRVRVDGDGLHGEEDVAGAHGVLLADGLQRALLRLGDAAAGREEVVGVALGADAAELRPLDEALHGAQVARRVHLPPPGAVAPAGGTRGAPVEAVGGSAGGVLVAPLDDEEIAALDL